MPLAILPYLPQAVARASPPCPPLLTWTHWRGLNVMRGRLIHRPQPRTAAAQPEFVPILLLRASNAVRMALRRLFAVPVPSAIDADTST